MTDLASSSGGGTSFALEDAVEVLERRKWWILLSAALGLAVGFALYLVLPPVYTARTTILVEPQEVPHEFVKTTVTLGVHERLHTLKERVTSYSNLNELIDLVGAERLDATGRLSRDALMGVIRSGIGVEIAGANRASFTTVFHVGYAARDPELAADVVRELASLFITENLKDRAQQAAATSEFLDRELDRLRAEVERNETEIRRFKESRMGFLPGQLDANLRTLDRLNFQLAANLEAQESVLQRIALLRRQMSSGNLAATDPTNVAVALRELRQRLFEAEILYTPEHPNVKALRARIARLEEEAAQVRDVPPEEPTRADPSREIFGPELEAANWTLENHQEEEQRLRQDIAELTTRVDAAPRVEQDFADLTRDYQNLMGSYHELLSKKLKATVARNLELEQKGERFKVLRPARVPSSPSWPDLTLFLPGGMAAGLAVAALFILAAEIRNPSFRSVSRLSRGSGLPVVASIPRIDARVLESPSGDEVDWKLVPQTAPDSAIAEQYRGFIPVLLAREKCRVVIVTSAARGDGKSLTCMNLAATVAHDLNRRVLVIDGDLRRPTAHRLLHLSRRRGLSNVLKRELSLEEGAVPSKIENLRLLPSGPSVRNPLALLTDQAFFDLLDEARRHYDLIFIDSPPMLPVVDTRVLQRMADFVLFVVRADATPRDAVVRSLRELQEVAGIVFNQVSAGSYRRYYYYDAYSRYAYGEPDDGTEAEDPRA